MEEMDDRLELDDSIVRPFTASDAASTASCIVRACCRSSSACSAVSNPSFSKSPTLVIKVSSFVHDIWSFFVLPSLMNRSATFSCGNSYFYQVLSRDH
jgi:hypothetical protein